VEPIHGTAPQLVGKDAANPSGTILCISLLLRERFGEPQAAEAVERALDAVLAAGIRTADIAEPGTQTASGSQFTGEVRARLQKSPRAAERTA
jgi:3-isopropylmalate dehydrogenase